MRLLLHVVLCALHLCGVAQAAERVRVVVVVGAPGSDEFGSMFEKWQERIVAACERGEAEVVLVGGETASETPDRLALQRTLEDSGEARQLWLILFGHGTFDGKTARFNLRGPDVSAVELAEWLDEVPCPAAIINCSSASGPFIEKLSGEGRIVVTSTKSGYEHNFSRFGDYFSRSLTDVAADLDKDDQVSLLEAFLFASRRVEEFYADESRLATEHALVDDNGDGQGTAAGWFQGVRVVKKAQDDKRSPDGAVAHQLHLVLSSQERNLLPEAIARRNELEQELAALGQRKADLPVDEYYRAVEAIALELARIYHAD